MTGVQTCALPSFDADDVSAESNDAGFTISIVNVCSNRIGSELCTVNGQRGMLSIAERLRWRYCALESFA